MTESTGRADRALPVLVSPTAGAGTGRRAESVLRRLISPHFTPDFQYPVDLDDLRHLVHQIVRAGSPHLAVAGGDGMLHHVVNAVGGAALLVAPIPIGSGNDFCRGVGLSIDPESAIRALASQARQRVDLLEVNGTRVCTVAGLGFVADTGIQVGRLLAPGSRWRPLGRAMGDLSYLSAAALRLMFHPRISGSIRLRWQDPDGAERQDARRVYGVLAANLPTLGAGLKLPVPSRVDDGVFEIVMVNERSRMSLARSLSCLRSDRPVPPGTIDVIRAVSATLDWEAGSRLLGDGEDLGAASAFSLRALPAALEVPAQPE